VGQPAGNQAARVGGSRQTLIVQLYGHAACLGEQQLVALVLMAAGVVPAEGGGTDGAAIVLVRIKG
jgi:hypothetical protein